ncbi:Armadillo repeat-containing protein 3 [Kappamyces sp. JEL0680]|nr:Armadillo repeat-containing protein 3 [Kappamyces sp. JEL0680]
MYLLGLGVIKPLIDMCKSTDKRVKKAGISCLSSSTEAGMAYLQSADNAVDLHPDMKRRDLIEELIQILQTEDQVDILDEAAYALANISKDCRSGLVHPVVGNKVEMKRLGAVTALVKLLENADPDVKKNSAVALASLLEDFGIRAEVRDSNGLRPIMELLLNEHQEVQENGLRCFIKASEDASNRAEYRKLGVLKRLLEYLGNDNNSSLFALALHCLSLYLDDAETVASLADQGGIAILAKLVSAEDIQVKKNVAAVFVKALKSDRSQQQAKETGFIATLVGQLAGMDMAVAACAASIVAALAKNETNLLELVKLGAVEGLVRMLMTEEKDYKRECLGALACLSTHAKARPRIRSSTENIAAIVKLVGAEDAAVSIHAADCIVALSEDVAIRAEIVKLNAVHQLIGALDSQDPKIQCAACLALSRLLLEADAQTSLSKSPKVLTRLVELLHSQDTNVCRNVSYTLSIAAQNETNATIACQGGAIDALIQLSKDSAKKSKKFASEALEKLLNFHNG